MRNFTFLMLITLAIFGGFTRPLANPLSDDTTLFSVTVPPYTLIILDMSGSMRCKVDATNCGRAGEEDAPDDPTQRRMSVARKILKDLLDVTNDRGNKLNLNLGYMNFTGIGGPKELCNKDNDGDATKGNIKVLADLGSSDKSIWNKIKDPTPECSDRPDCQFTGTTGVTGCTPLAATLAEAKNYFDGQIDTATQCRKRFIIYITDGGDNLACSISDPNDCTSSLQDCDSYNPIN